MTADPAGYRSAVYRSAVYRRVLRRETHAPRTTPASIVAVVLALAVLGALVLGVWTSIDPGFRASVTEVADNVAAVAETVAVRVGAGVVLLVIAVLLIGAAVLPGHRNRRARLAGRIGMVIDDGVLADAAADRVAERCGIDRSQVSVTVGRRAVLVRVTPTSGVPVGTETAREAASEALSAAGFDTAVKASVAGRGTVS